MLVLALCVPGGLTYGYYQAEIPNGDHVPHPCKPNFIWHGVGHRNVQGGGDRNPFGEDFASEGHVVRLFWGTLLWEDFASKGHKP